MGLIKIKDHEFNVKWSQEDSAWIARTSKFESLAAHGSSPNSAIKSLTKLIEDTMVELVLEDMSKLIMADMSEFYDISNITLHDNSFKMTINGYRLSGLYTFPKRKRTDVNVRIYLRHYPTGKKDTELFCARLAKAIKSAAYKILKGK